ncbi:phospholysine phosphohistidine inorganic pyrophosphate phosphatase-like isoform X2 [Acanthaster planci]|uniref:Phospholysine phosphohistidine inorganic pyrophosphate phosphatase n=1 Tax=Acanthaster planci TaxID=133434 RepID=A0A8B7XL74_ACAPL|nr:phospholysine phosphohistidine inorganic pyrophosphate phosphatase-like isoform X2 [Acanthaster planci]
MQNVGDQWGLNLQGVLLDISGVLYDSGDGGGTPIAGSIEAVKRLKTSGLKVRFCTNESQCTRQTLVDKLRRLGFDISLEEVFSPAPAACQLVRERGLHPFLLIHPDAVSDFSEFDLSLTPNCVVIGDAAMRFSYDRLNAAFRILIGQEHPVLIAMGKGRYYKETDGLMMDVGCFMAALEYATGCKAEVVGKPDKGFFLAAVNDMGIKPEHALMVGDDIVNDVGGAQSCGIKGVQVRTGKFRPSDENHPTVRPDGFVDNLAHAVDILLKAHAQ